MDTTFISIVIVPGVFALLLFLVFSYLHQQSREPYFRAWQLAWAAYSVYYAALVWTMLGHGGAPAYLLARLLFAGVIIGIFVSTRLVEEDLRFRWPDFAMGGAVVALAVINGVQHAMGGFRAEEVRPHLELEVVAAALLLVSALRFYRVSRQRHSMGFRLLTLSLAIWAPLLVTRQFHGLLEQYFGQAGHFIGPLPQVLIAISMVVVLFENERRVVQENALAFSTLEVDTSHLLSPAEVEPALEKILRRLTRVARVEQAALCIAEHWRAVLPSVGYGLAPDLVSGLDSIGAGEYLVDMAYRSGGLASFRNLPQMTEPLPAGAPGRFDRTRDLLLAHGIRNLTAISVQTRNRNFGAILLPRAGAFGPSQMRLLLDSAMQIGMTLENYVIVHETQRRTREYELLTQIGQVISSRLDPEDVLRTIHKELGLLFDTETFYIAMLDGDEVRFEFEMVEGKHMPKRTRKVADAFTEHVIRTGQPLLVKSDLEKVRARLGLTFVPDRPAKSFAAVPIFMHNRAVGVMAAMNYEREFVYQERDLEVMQTAAGQVAVAMENARLFSEEQRRSRYLAFLNNVSKTAISSQDSEEMLAEISAALQKNFAFDHIGIGVLDYSSKEIEIKAEAGTTAKALGKRVPLGVGILGRCARSNEMMLVQNVGEGPLMGILPDSRSALCIPLTYGESLLGVLNVESRREAAFDQQEVLILRTLADLLATALHNAFIFRKLQQQSITDGLTGVKTRRFFLEAVQAEWKRASRSARPLSVVLVDLDKFKEVNDTMGHLEGDLVLARVGRLLEQKCRQSNVVARYGGDEFVILMPETTVEQAQILSERLRLWLATDPMLNERHITGSFGVGTFPVHGATVEEIIRVADAGMYVSKHAGGNRVSTAEPFGGSESAAAQRRLVTAYVEGFLQREHTGPESVEELVSTLKKMCGAVQSREAMMDIVLTLSRATESREVHAAGHGEAVSHYAEALGHELGMTEDEVEDLAYAARVHDLGKLIVPEKILEKPGPLSEDEYYIVKMHASVSAEIIACIPDSEQMQAMIKHHHEWLDGTGYPDGLQGEDIPLGARVLHVVDAYVNMTSDRSFAQARSAHEAMAELERNSGTQFDGMIVRLFLRQLKGERAAKRGK